MTRHAEVLRAIKAGAATSRDVAAIVGITPNNAKVMVHNLMRRGLLRWIGKHTKRGPSQRGRVCRVYEAT